MALFLCVVLIIWLACVHQKLNSLSGTVKYLESKLNKLIVDTNMQKRPSEDVIPAKKVEDTPIQQAQQPVLKEEIKPVEYKNETVELHKETPQFDAQPQKATQTSKSDFQSVFLGNIFNKIGAITIIIAVIIFIKLVSSFIHITPEMTVAIAYISGGIMAVGALFMHMQEKLKIYSEVLLGTGFATLFINTFCAYSYFKVFTTPVVIGVSVGLLLATYIIADRMKTLSMLIIGLLGGYLTPFLSGADNNVIFSYLIFLNLISLLYTLKNKHNRVINLINLIITMFVMIDYNLFNKINSIYPLVLWGIYLVYDILRDKSSKIDTTLSCINYFVLTVFTMTLYHDNHVGLGVLFASTAVGYLILAAFSRVSKNDLYKYYEHYILINIWLFVFFILNDLQSVIVWSVVPLLVSLLIKKFELNYLKGIVVWYYIAAFAGVLTAKAGGDYVLMAHYNPIVNLRAVVTGVPAISMLASSIILKDCGKNISNLLSFSGVSLLYLFGVGELNSYFAKFALTSSYKAFNQALSYVILGFIYALNMKNLYNNTKYLLYEVFGYIIFGVSLLALLITSYIYPTGYMVVANMRFAAYIAAITACIMYIRWTKAEFFKYLAVILGFFLVHSECVGVKNNFGEQFQYIISLGWVLYSGIITTVGIIRSKNFLKYIGIVLSLLTVARIFIFDLARVDAVYKLIICLVLGVILMFVSYIYTARNKN